MKTYNCSNLTGGGTRALDALVASTLANGDRAFAALSGVLRYYVYDSAATDAESSPNVIRPNDYGAAGVWKLQILDIDTSTIASGEIIGGGMYSIGGTSLSVLACACWDSTRSVYLETTAHINPTWPVAGTYTNGDFFNVYIAKLANNSTTILIYRDTDAVQIASDTNVLYYRWIDFVNYGATTWNLSYSVGGYHSFLKASESILSAGIGASYAAVDHSVLLPIDHIYAIEYGVKDSSTAGEILASDDGTNLSFYIGTASTAATDTTASAWADKLIAKASLKPFNSARNFKASTGTLDLLCHQVVLKR